MEPEQKRRLGWMIGAAFVLLLIMLIVPRFKPSAHPGETDDNTSIQPASIATTPATTVANNNTLSTSIENGGLTGNATTKDSTETATGTGGFSLGAGGAFSLIWRLGLVVVVIGGSIFGLRWWNRRVSGPRSTTGYLRIVDTLAFQGGRSVHLVAVGERVLVVGATTQQLSFLTELEDDEATTILKQQAANDEQSVSAFAAQLFQSLKRDVPGGPSRIAVAEETE